MNRFDEKIRSRAQAEKMRLTVDAEERFRDGMEEAHIACAQCDVQKPGKKKALIWLVSAECILAALLIFALLPARDVTDQAGFPQETQAAISAAMQPVTLPQVSFEGAALNGEVSLYGAFRNQSDDIWLVEWTAQFHGDAAQSQGLIWLEPGAECTERIAWKKADGETVITAAYRGLRVDARVLHWTEGGLLAPEEEGYQEQQSLLEDAFAAQALILLPGAWENGQAGPMQLVLPDRYRQEHPQQSAVEYYLSMGILKDQSALCSGEESIRLVNAEQVK